MKATAHYYKQLIADCSHCGFTNIIFDYESYQTQADKMDLKGATACEKCNLAFNYEVAKK